MQIVMFDRQSIFIHGMKISLQHRIPGVSIQGASQADELWQKLESYPEALVMLDGALQFKQEGIQIDGDELGGTNARQTTSITQPTGRVIPTGGRPRA